MSKIDEDKLLIIILGVVIAVLVLAGGIIGCFFYRRYQSKSEIDEINCTNIFAVGIKEAKILTYRVEYTSSSPDQEVWIPPGPPQELHENVWTTTSNNQDPTSHYTNPSLGLPSISKFEPPPSYTENDENGRF